MQDPALRCTILAVDDQAGAAPAAPRELDVWDDPLIARLWLRRRAELALADSLEFLRGVGPSSHAADKRGAKRPRFDLPGSAAPPPCGPFGS